MSSTHNVIIAASVLAGILFGLAPALKTSQPDLHETLKEGGRGSSGVRHRAQGVFVVVELALALVLLAGAGLMIRSLATLWSVDPGFDPHNVLTFDTTFPSITSPDLIRRIHDKLNAVPGVKAVSLTAASRPMSINSELPFWFEGQPKPRAQAEMKWTQLYLVEPDYLGVMKTPLVRGRFLTPLLGVAIGLVAALGLTRLMAKMLFGVSPHDPLTFAGVAGLLTLVALAACYIPARRATMVDPIVALRYE